MISVFLLEQGFSNPHDSIVASVPHVADCHHAGAGPIRTGQSVVIDIFPRDDETRYWGDCTRTVVHGEPNDELSRMHAAVVEAKAASLAAMRAGVTGEQVHRATASVLEARGYVMGVAPESAPDDFTSMPHGTGHGIGLDVHEPILLDRGGGSMLAGEVFTVEPGLYSRAWGGVRVEDMVVVTGAGCENLNTLPEGLAW
jgi:Xaa-Pro aminopeptidase